MPKVNPDILIWARMSAGLTPAEACKKLQIKERRLEEIESGKTAPTRRQLVNMSEKYRRPLLTFYLSKQPQETDKGQDYRTLPGGKLPDSEALLDALLRNVIARQGLVRAALEDAEEDEPIAFVGSASIRDGIEQVVDMIEDSLQFSAKIFHDEKTVNDAFSSLRSAAERAGVFVLLMGNLGTHHTDIDPEVFRGFALSDKIAPFVVINEKDSKAAWSFTLLHELTHIFLGETAISGYEGDAAVERFCDAVAARFLLQPADLAAIDTSNIKQLLASVTSFAQNRNVSRKMIAYNLLNNGHISRRLYQQLSSRFDEDRIAEMAARKERGGAADYYVVRRHRAGHGLVSFVKRMVSDGRLSSVKAGTVLGVKPTAVRRTVNQSNPA